MPIARQGHLAETVGVSASTVMWWCRAGLLPDQPATMGHGNHRVFTARDYAVARILATTSRALDNWEPPSLTRRRLGEAARDAVLRGEKRVTVEILPGFKVVMEWGDQ